MNKHEELVQLVEMMRMHSRHWTAEWNKNNPLDISLSQALTLEVLKQEGPRPSTYLSQTVGVTSGGMTVISDKLVKQKLVRRASDSNDRRVVKLELTDAGHDAVSHNQAKREELVDKLFGALTQAEVRQMAGLYRKLLDSVVDQPK